MNSLYFLYHELRPAKSDYSYVMPCAEFEAHCVMFAQTRRAGRTGLRAEITFDDGYLSDIRYAAPILAAHQLRASFFITAGWTGTRAGFMSPSELRELHGAGHRIGAHGMTHKLLTTCTPQELDVELRDARKRLQDLLGAEVRTMSLPGGRANARVLRACAAAGFEQVFTSMPAAVDIAGTAQTVGRLNLHSGTSVDWLQEVLAPGSGLLKRVNRRHRIKARAQRLLGDRMYARIWAVVNGEDPTGRVAESDAL